MNDDVYLYFEFFGLVLLAVFINLHVFETEKMPHALGESHGFALSIHQV